MQAVGPKIYSLEYYRRIAEIEESYWWHRGLRAIQAALLESSAERTRIHRALDAGCGPGGMLAWLRRFAVAEWVAGIDIAPEALLLCRAKQDHHIAQASVLALPFIDASFDLVVCLDVIQ